MNAKVSRVEVTCAACSATFLITQSRLNRGRGKFCSRSCNALFRSTRHGHTTHDGQSPTYMTWTNMTQRCTNPRAPKYSTYGAKGITICEEWKSFDRFLSDMGERPEGSTIDRINGEFGYSRENCRWATIREQQENLRTNTWLTFQGERVSICSLARLLGLSKATLRYRIKQGWSDDALASKPDIGNRSRA